jgi:hypothetical protein
VPADWKPNPGLGQPLYGPTAGIGIAQLDPANLVEPDQYWDWQASLQGGYKIWEEKLEQAKRWAQSEQTRLDNRLKAAIAQASANRGCHHPCIDMDAIQVPQLTDQQLIYQAIRYYNGQQEYHFDADYVLSANGLDVNLVGTQRWVGGTDPAVYGAPSAKDGHWGAVPHNLQLRQPWVEYPANQNYVDQVRTCKNS